MGYELAKQLKDAGFIQRKWRHAFYYLPRINSLGEQMIGTYEEFGDYNESVLVYIPDFSELIEACGEKTVLFENGEKWWAAKLKGNCFGDHYIDEGIEYLNEGNTPEGAVARLWLELNK